ncbi:hypothetical protein Patl1_07677 [Pistacia atlantica]|uniref:Uncharacterized protein n=1 Tax=Pistacia atlantica TaxID=434234 RepID=A0ACC1AJD1_9ROSI|nr:hypothetical protein Patl1_07677 [Pistacia atlantica]
MHGCSKHIDVRLHFLRELTIRLVLWSLCIVAYGNSWLR